MQGIADYFQIPQAKRCQKRVSKKLKQCIASTANSFNKIQTASMSNLLRVSIFKLQSSRHYYRKTELGTNTARSQLCINLVLRRYANKGSFTKLSLLFEYTHYPSLLLLQIIHSHSLIFQQQLLMKDAYMCFYYQKIQKTF